MSRRGSDNSSDSLDLLLDTICNVFGGIILMAILVVIQTQTTAGRIPQRSEQSGEFILSDRKLRHEIDKLREELGSTINQKSILSESYQASSSPATDLLLHRREKFIEAVGLAERRLMELRVQKRENEVFLAGLGKKEKTLENEVEKTQEKKEETIRQIRNKRTISKTVRLPHQHRQSATRQVNYMVVGKRVFPINAEHVIQNSLPSSGTLHVPRAKMGYPVSKEGKNSREFILDISDHSPKRIFISFWVRCDNESFISFQELRAVAVKRGFEYSVSPYSAQPGLVLFRGRPPVE